MATKRAVRTPGDTQPDTGGDAAAVVVPVDAARDSLPDESEVDPYSIRKAVLTKQGWVCPADIPTPPAKE